MLIANDIDVITDINSEEFKKKYFIPQKPVVIRNLIKNEEAGKKWNFDYFKTTMGNLDVDVYDNSIKNDSSAYTSADFKMKFKDFLTVIEKNEYTGLRMFLFNLFKYNSQLRKEFPCPAIFKGILDNVGFTFFGGKDTVVRMHYDIDMSNILHTQVWGHKRVVLFSPENNDLLYTLPLNTYTLANIENPDYDSYPGLRFVKGHECLLQPGDTVFIPSGYWHLMTYLDGGMSVAYRKIAPTFKTKLQGVLNLGVYMPIDKLMAFIFNQKWVSVKIKIAQERANKSIKKLHLEQNKSMALIDVN
jgi:ribosomal protein L16 Arg81 hydroxylase